MTSALRCVVGGQHHPPAALPPGKIRYQLYRRLCGPHGRSGRVRKISPPTGFDPRTVQPAASSYTDWAIPDPCNWIVTFFKSCFSRSSSWPSPSLPPLSRHSSHISTFLLLIFTAQSNRYILFKTAICCDMTSCNLTGLSSKLWSWQNQLKRILNPAQTLCVYIPSSTPHSDKYRLHKLFLYIFCRISFCCALHI